MKRVSLFRFSFLAALLCIAFATSVANADSKSKAPAPHAGLLSLPAAPSASASRGEKDVDRGWKFIAARKPEQAIAVFDKASEEGQKENYLLPWGYGIANAQLAKFPESIAAFTLAEQMKPSESRLFSDYGFSYMQWGLAIARAAKNEAEEKKAFEKWNAAEEKFKKAAELAPNESLPSSRLAMLNYYRGDLAGAWHFVQQSRLHGGEDLDPRFVADLSKHMPEPK